MNRDELKARIEKVKQWDVLTFGEMQAKRAIIEPIFDCLDWETSEPDEVFLEYPTHSGERVDYAFLKGSDPLVLIEAKRPGESLDNPRYIEQILKYAFQKGVPLAILSNAIEWSFYLPLEKGDWQTRKFYSIDLNTQDIDSVCDRFIEFLSKDNVLSGTSLESAKKMRKSAERRLRIQKTLPEVWNTIITEPNEILVELLIEETERRCGFKPDESQVKDFISKITRQPKLSGKDIQDTQGPHKRRDRRKSQLEDFQNKHPKSYTFLGGTYHIRQWNEILTGICSIMAERHKDTFEQFLLSIRGRTCEYFSRDKRELEQPREIPGTDLYAMTHLGANAIVSRSKDVIQLFGYDPGDLKIETSGSE